MNPCPKTIIPGFYILILDFKFSLKSSSKMDIIRCSLKNLTGTAQTTATAVLLFMTF